MFKKSKRRIVAYIMSVLVFVWVGTLGVIYTSSYFEMTKQNERMLRSHAEMFILSPGEEADYNTRPKREKGENRFDPNFADSPVFQLSTFYSVAIDYNGELIEIKNSKPNLHSDSDLKALADKIIARNKISGGENNLFYYKADKTDYILVVFMDNTVINENAAMLLRYTVLFGAVVIIALFFLSVHLADKIFGPIEESYKKQKQFISDAGHELKTPVSVVNANAELLIREIGENQWLENILYENERMGILVGQLLELARTESVTPQMESIDFSRLIQGEALPFESVAFERGLELVSKIQDNISVEGNPAQLRQLTSILLDNAMHHSEGGSKVELILSKEHSTAVLSVINKGEEIPEEHRGQIFERFYRVDSARSGEDNHYGLGLAIAKAIAESHKGNIELMCENSLVKFRVILPIKADLK